MSLISNPFSFRVSPFHRLCLRFVNQPTMLCYHQQIVTLLAFCSFRLWNRHPQNFLLELTDLLYRLADL